MNLTKCSNMLSLMIIGKGAVEIDPLAQEFYVAVHKGGGIFAKFIDYPHEVPPELEEPGETNTDNIPLWLQTWRNHVWGGSDLTVIEAQAGEQGGFDIEGAVLYATVTYEGSVPYSGFELLAEATGTTIVVMDCESSNITVTGNVASVDRKSAWMYSLDMYTWLLKEYDGKNVGLFVQLLEMAHTYDGTGCRFHFKSTDELLHTSLGSSLDTEAANKADSILLTCANLSLLNNVYPMLITDNMTGVNLTLQSEYQARTVAEKLGSGYSTVKSLSTVLVPNSLALQATSCYSDYLLAVKANKVLARIIMSDDEFKKSASMVTLGYQTNELDPLLELATRVGEALESDTLIYEGAENRKIVQSGSSSVKSMQEHDIHYCLMHFIHNGDHTCLATVTYSLEDAKGRNVMMNPFIVSVKTGLGVAPGAVQLAVTTFDGDYIEEIFNCDLGTHLNNRTGVIVDGMGCFYDSTQKPHTVAWDGGSILLLNQTARAAIDIVQINGFIK